MINMKKKMPAVLLVFLLSLVFLLGCSKKPGENGTKETSSEEQTETESVIPDSSGSDISGESLAEEKTAEETASETETADASKASESLTEETEMPKSHEGEELFFGHYTDSRIAALNRKTLSVPEAGLYDVLSDAVFTAEDVQRMIESYSFPATAYLGEEAYSEEKAAGILENRNLAALQDGNVSLRYAVLSDNADVRSFPTMLAAKNELTEEAFDMIQESGFSAGEGVLVLHESADGNYLFVRGGNYFGWIQREKAAFCGFSEFSEYLSEERFIVVLKQRFEADTHVFRLGTVLPYREKTEEGYLVLAPERDEEGNLRIREITVPENPEAVSDGFLPYSPEDLTNRSFTLVGFPYGWGDTNQYYDCSSTAGLLYQCYGIRLPRNTSVMKYFDAGEEYSVSVEGLTEEEKLEVIAAHPGAVLVMNGHAMIYGGRTMDPEGTVHYIVVHANSGYFDSPAADVFHPVYMTAEADLKSLYRADGTSFLSGVHTILYFE